MCQRWAANAIKIKASRLHCPLRQHWRPGGNGKETLSRPRWLPFFSFYSIHTPSVRLFHQHKMQKKKKRITTSKSARLSQQRIASQRTNKNFEFFFYEKYRLCVSKIRLTSLADRKRREAAVPCGFVADVEHAHTKTSRSHTHTHRRCDWKILTCRVLYRQTSIMPHFSKCTTNPPLDCCSNIISQQPLFYLRNFFFFFFSSQRPFPVRPHGGLFIPANGSIVCDDCNSIMLRRLTWTFHFWVGSWGQSTGLGRSILC